MNQSPPKKRMCLKCKEIAIHPSQVSDLELGSNFVPPFVCSNCGWTIEQETYKMSTKVVNIRRYPHDVYIGRPSEFGNPFALEKNASRAEVILRYRDHLIRKGRWDLAKQKEYLKHKLKGKERGLILGCFCNPKACHGHVLAAVVDDLDWDYYLPPDWKESR